MSEFVYATNTTIENVIARIRDARKVLVTSHEKPDGDAIGSCAAVARALRVLGIPCEVWVLGAISDSLLALVPDLEIHRAPGEVPADDHDLVLVVDTGAWAQLEPLAEWLRQRTDSVISIDHHARGDEVASERIVESSDASCTQVLVPLIDALGVKLEEGADANGRYSIAEAILVGLATDTGWFRFSSCDARALRLAARLIEAGADKSSLIRIIEESDRPQRIEMAARALASARFSNGDRSVVMGLSARDFEETGARPEELSGLVNGPMCVGTVEVSVLLTEVREGHVKMSFRSKPAIAGAGRGFIDVNEVAGTFGGGGHVHAAGARADGSLEDVVQQVEAALARALQEAGFSSSTSTV